MSLSVVSAEVRVGFDGVAVLLGTVTDAPATTGAGCVAAAVVFDCATALPITCTTHSSSSLNSVTTSLSDLSAIILPRKMSFMLLSGMDVASDAIVRRVEEDVSAGSSSGIRGADGEEVRER